MPAKKTKDGIRIPKVTLLPSGSWFVRVMIDGKSISITKPTKNECIAEYIALKHGAKEAELHSKTQSVTLRECLDKYIERRVDKKSPSTIKGYMSYRNNRLQTMMDRNVYEITDLQWQVAVDKEFKNLSDKYAKNVWSFVSSAVEEETGTRPKVDLEAPMRNTRPWLDPDQITVFVEAIKGLPIEIPALLELSSLRISEVLDVRGTDVDLAHNRIRVRGAAVYGPDGKLVHKDRNKTQKSTRYVPIIPPLRDILERIPLTEDFLVTMSQGGIYKAINRVCVANGLPEVGNHGLRHSFASLAFFLGIEEAIAQEIGGWEDRKTMHEIYTHLAEKQIADRAERFSNFFVTNSLQK